MADEEDIRISLARFVVAPDLAADLNARQAAVESPNVGRRDGRKSSLATRLGTRSAGLRARVIIELSSDFQEGIGDARREVLSRLSSLGLDRSRLEEATRKTSRHNVFAELNLREIEGLENWAENGPSPILRIWRDSELKPFLIKSIRTIKADACAAAFGAHGEDIVVAVADSGIAGDHPHFTLHRNLEPPAGLRHRDFTGSPEQPLVDGFGHGTHVAGIVSGETDASQRPVGRVSEFRDARGTLRTEVNQVPPTTVLRGVAPRCKILSLKVLDGNGRGLASSLIAALEYVEEANDYGRRIKVHCVNISLGYPFDAAWVAAGHSPLCSVVNRLSRSGVAVVAAAGNDGSALVATEGRVNHQRVGIGQSINDPGNAEEAITVGATHSLAPHTYGVSYFSSRGPTSDGRMKPDLVAPGERILSCVNPDSKKFLDAMASCGVDIRPDWTYFREESGTSMAAPHVAGSIAAFLSVRPEFIGRPELIKATLVATCTDLKRKADFQGAGLLDLLRALQSV